MPIIASDLAVRLSGGASNTTAATSLGGGISSQPAPASLFDSVAGAEAAAGDTEYRCVYVRNNNATTTAANLAAWLTANTASPSTDIAIGLGTSVAGGAEQSIANENTAPSGVTFVAATSKAAGLALGNLAAGSWRAVWFRRTVTAGAAATANDGATLRLECEAG